MAYTVFALKWRPQGFDEIVGQEHIAATLKSAIQNNRLANAYLFAGPRGVGKTSTARILAKALNCKQFPAFNPCGKCNSCVEITAGRSLDVIEIDGASNRQIDDIRTLRENVKFAPTHGKFKVYIIDEVHMLTTEAFNALLKTLEEPPSFVKFIFATTHPHKVPLTILSRCQRMDFRRIKALEIVAQLSKITKAENITVDKEVLFAVAKAGDGSLRDAESILDQLSAFSGNNVSLKDVVSVLGLIEQEALFEITDKIIAKDAVTVLGLFDKLIDNGKDISVFAANLLEHFRNLMVTKVSGADPELVDLPQEACEKLAKQSQFLTLEEIFRFFNALVNAQEMGKRLESLRIPLEICLVKLAQNKTESQAINAPKPDYPKPIAEKPAIQKPVLNPLQKTADFNPVKIPSETVKKNTEPRPVTEINLSVTLEDIKDVWQAVFANLSRVKMSIATYFSEGAPLKLEKNILTVAFSKNHSLHKETLEKKENKDLIEKTLSAALKIDTPVRINFILSKEVNKEAAVVQTDNNLFLKTALETFSGRVISEG